MPVKFGQLPCRARRQDADGSRLQVIHPCPSGRCESEMKMAARGRDAEVGLRQMGRVVDNVVNGDDEAPEPGLMKVRVA